MALFALVLKNVTVPIAGFDTFFEKIFAPNFEIGTLRYYG